MFAVHVQQALYLFLFFTLSQNYVILLIEAVVVGEW